MRIRSATVILAASMLPVISSSAFAAASEPEADTVELNAGDTEVTVSGDEVVSELANGTLSVELPLEGDVSQVSSSTAMVSDSETSTGFSLRASAKGVQIIAVIGEPSAPHDLRYGIDVSTGIDMSLKADGSVDVRNATGDLVAQIATPWARDSEGKPVATYFTLRGADLVQIVEPTPSNTYPIFADPDIIWGDQNKIFQDSNYWCSVKKVKCKSVNVTTPRALESWYMSNSFCAGFDWFGCAYRQEIYFRKFTFVATVYDTSGRQVVRFTGQLTKEFKRWCGVGICGSMPSDSLGVGESQNLNFWG